QAWTAVVRRARPARRGDAVAPPWPPADAEVVHAARQVARRLASPGPHRARIRRPGLRVTSLVFVTQQVDPEHPVLAATVPKIRALARRLDEVTVLAASAVEGALP